MSDHGFISILNRMQSRLKTAADKREGTWTADNLQAVANELARIYAEDIDNILPQAFVATAEGENLDSACSDYGITRRGATFAEVWVELAGAPGVYEGLEVLTGNISFMVETVEIPPEGSVTAKAVCTTAGSLGNVAAGSIDKASSNRITKVTNPKDAAGGFDRETDEDLRARTLEYIRTPAASGNIAHYMQWAKEVPGVHKARVFDLARGNGTVDVVLIADQNEETPQILVDAVAAHIEEQRPIGADVLVVSAQPVEVAVQAAVLAVPGYTADAIGQLFYERLQEYCEQVAFAAKNRPYVDIVSYLGIVSLLFECSGVVDVTSYTINGRSESLQMGSRQFPVACRPTITVKEVRDA